MLSGMRYWLATKENPRPSSSRKSRKCPRSAAWSFPLLQPLGNGNSGELEDIRIAEDILGLPHLAPIVRQSQHSFLVTGKRNAVEQHRLHLPPQFADAPFRDLALLHVESDFQGIVGAKDFEIVAPRQKSGRLDFSG